VRCWREMVKISWHSRVRNEVLHGDKEETSILHTKKKEERLIGLFTSHVGTVFLSTLLKERQKEK
jgi:hypothetical protein